MPSALADRHMLPRSLLAVISFLIPSALAADLDQDGLDDALEVSTYSTNPADPDTDLDHLSDGDEVLIHRTNPLQADTDGDQARDDWELRAGLNPLDWNDHNQDSDGDGLPNGSEAMPGGNPFDPDSDGDGLPDGFEELYAPRSYAPWERESNLDRFSHVLPNHHLHYDQPLRRLAGVPAGVLAGANGVVFHLTPGNLRVYQDLTSSVNDAGTLARPELVTPVSSLVSHGRLWVVDTSRGLHAYNLTQPLNPAFAFTVVTNGYRRAKVHGDTLWLYDRPAGGDSWVALDLSVPGEPPVLARHQSPSTVRGLSFLTNEVAVATGQGLSLFRLDSPSAAPVLLGHGNVPSPLPGEEALEVLLLGKIAMLGTSHRLVYYDLFFPTFPRAWPYVLHPDENSGFGRIEPLSPDFYAVHSTASSGVSIYFGRDPDAFFPATRNFGWTIGGGADTLVDPSSFCVFGSTVASIDFLGLTLVDIRPEDANRNRIPDIEEWKLFGDLNNDAFGDEDADGITNLGEYEWGSHPLHADIDADGLGDAEELPLLTNPRSHDTDHDGLSDGDEVNAHGTNPLRADTDGDGLPDPWEVRNGLDPNSDSDATEDQDGDFVNALEEFTHDLNPRDADTDDDGLSDGWERDQNLDPRTQPARTTHLFELVAHGLGTLPAHTVAWNVGTSTPFLYAADFDGFAQGLDVSIPTSPVTGEISTPVLAGRGESTQLAMVGYLSVPYLANGHIRMVQEDAISRFVPEILDLGGLRARDLAQSPDHVRLMGCDGVGFFELGPGNQILYTFAVDVPMRRISPAYDAFLSVAGVDDSGAIHLFRIDETVNGYRTEARWTNTLGRVAREVAALADGLAVSYSDGWFEWFPLPLTNAVPVAAHGMQLAGEALELVAAPDALGDGRTLVFAALGTNGLAAIDVSDPDSLRLAGLYPMFTALQDIDWEPNHRLLAGAASQGKVFLWQLGLRPEDSDLDGLPDPWEIAHWNSLLFAGADTDFDGDGLLDRGEHITACDPLDSDSDNDGMTDGLEIAGLMDPVNAASVLRLSLTPDAAGAVDASWPSNARAVYTLYCSPGPNGPWTPVPGAQNVVGDGSPATCPVPAGAAGYFRLQMAPPP